MDFSLVLVVLHMAVDSVNIPEDSVVALEHQAQHLPVLPLPELVDSAVQAITSRVEMAIILVAALVTITTTQGMV